jgi:hypothetical protein
MWTLGGLAALLVIAVCGVAGCATVNPKPVEIDMPAAARHFIVASFALVDA